MNQLLGLIESNINVKEVEPDIYTVLEQTEKLNSYDGLFGDFYDIVACNPVYNKIIWGVDTKKFGHILENLLNSGNGPILDAGCGSLAFTYEFYRDYDRRPVVFLDQSMNLLRKAKRRLTKKNRTLTDNKLILQGDAFTLPFQAESFTTIVSMNLLHALTDINPFLSAMTTMAEPGSDMIFTTLIKNNRYADKILKKWDDAGEVTTRTQDELDSIFKSHGLDADFELMGNIAFIRCNKS